MPTLRLLGARLCVCGGGVGVGWGGWVLTSSETMGRNPTEASFIHSLNKHVLCAFSELDSGNKD